MPPRENVLPNENNDDLPWEPSSGGPDELLGLGADPLTDALADSLADAALGGYLHAADQSDAPLELDLAEFSRAFLPESPLSGQRAMRVDAEVIARLDVLFEGESGRPFGADDGKK